MPQASHLFQLFLTHDTSDVIIERLTLHHARSGGMVLEKGCERITVHQVTAYANEFDGIAAYVTKNSTFSDLNVHDNDAAGFSFDLDFNNNIVLNSVINQNGDVGIFMRHSRDNIFSAIQIIDNGNHGVFLAENDLTKVPALGNTFESMLISNSDGAGIRVNDASCVNNLVIGAQLSGNAGGCFSGPAVLTQFGNICR